MFSYIKIMRKEAKKLYKLEAMRGFAALYVVFHHLFAKQLTIFGIDISIFFRFGQEAVILFFVLSGFVIQFAYQKSSDKSFRTFFLKRILRIYIPLLIVFITHAILAYSKNYQFRLTDLWTLFGNILMLQDVESLKPNVFCEPFLGNIPLWSLSYEWWFYVLFFVFSNCLSGKPSVLVYSFGFIATLSYLYYPNPINRELMYLIIWWIGRDIAILYTRKEKINFVNLKMPLLFLLVSTFLLAVNAVFINKGSIIGISPFLELRHFSFAFLVICTAIFWHSFNWVGFKQTFGLFEKVAPISFVIYISHYFLIVEATYLDSLVKNSFLRSALYLAICFGYSYLIERVIYMHLSNWILPGRRNSAKKRSLVDVANVIQLTSSK